MNQPTALVQNPFRPGAGQRPLYLAGRTHEQDQFRAMLKQSPISQNTIITGLRGAGKTVLLDELKPFAQSAGWLWTGNDMSESVSLTEESLARRIVVDLAALLSPMVVFPEQLRSIGFKTSSKSKKRQLGFDDLWSIYERTAGLTIDKLRAVLLAVWQLMEPTDIIGNHFCL